MSFKTQNNQFIRHVPNILSVFRMVTTPILFFFILSNHFQYGFILFLITIITDVIDGLVARKCDACTKIGGYLDVLADFTLIFALVIAFSAKQLFPAWVIYIVLFMFIQFIITSKKDRPVYDPFGKHYGSFLFLMLGVAFFNLNNQLISITLGVFICYTVLALSSRFYSLHLSNRRKSYLTISGSYSEGFKELIELKVNEKAL